MRSAYNEKGLHDLLLTKEIKRWRKAEWISEAQGTALLGAYESPFYHPNIIIRILLFIATLIALSGVTGIGLLMFVNIGEWGLSALSILYGVGSFFFMKLIFIDKNKHYKSGVTEALLYHACGYVLLGIVGLSGFNPNDGYGVGLILVCFVTVFTFTAIRYLDLVSTLLAISSLIGLLFYEFYNLGGLFQQLIPFLFIACFVPIYWLSRKLKKRKDLWIWADNLLIVESVSLIMIYLASNYLVVRELSLNLMDLKLESGDDIPFAWIFYGLTVALPIAYLYFGVKKKDVVLLRVSLVLFAASVFTFKYYFGFGHPEITLTVAGMILLAISLFLFNYLKLIRNGFTRENILTEKWGDANVAALVVSQTLGGNQISAEDPMTPGGGEFGGGGSSGSF